MTHSEWLRNDDVPQMIEAIWMEHGEDEAALVLQLLRYFVACCRRIWRLLPQEDSRSGIEVAERFLADEATVEELNEAIYHSEGAYFNLLYDCNPQSIDRWADEVAAIPAGELAAMLHSPGTIAGLNPREILTRAAGFAGFTNCFPLLIHKRGDWSHLALFMPAELLREMVEGPPRH